MKVLIYGLRGVGIETAKNLTLQGVGAITIIDNNPVVVSDLGLNFFLHEQDIGSTRATVVKPRLQELNPICLINVADKLTNDIILSHSALVITLPLPISKLIELDELCRSNGVSFLNAYSSGVSTTIFVDHGDNHIVNDKDGEKPLQKLIVDVKSISDTELLIRYESPEGQPANAIIDGCYEITEVGGIERLNGYVYDIKHPDSDPVKTIRVPFKLESSETYLSGGLVTEKKVPAKYPMESLVSKIKSPGSTYAFPQTLVLTDLINFGSEYQQHVAYIATLTFYEKFDRLPYPHNDNDSNEVLTIAKSLVTDKSIDIDDFEIDDKYIHRYVRHASVELQAISAFTGGVLSQEVVKCTGKLTPIPGFFHFSSYESLPDEIPAEEDRIVKSSRYDELAQIYGWKFIEKLKNSKYFMVGCGALGCEFLKNFALIGFCCGSNGKLVVTDPDRIELSNLSRQFLFREHNVGQPKSRAGTIMAKVMNKDLNIEPLELLVGPKSEDTFNDDFWSNLDGICNALDNIEARFYVDNKCVKYEKSLLESGTMGTGANVDTIVPFKTRTYQEGGNAAEGGGVPMCTLRNFPHITDHCIEWSRDQFEYLFVKLPKISEAYILNPSKFENDTKIKAGTEPGVAYFDVHSLYSFMRAVSNPSIGSCVQLAYDFFHYLFRDRILDLQAAFPQDSRIVDKNGVDKGPFWGEKRRYPEVAVFNKLEQVHLDFVISATSLFAVTIGLVPPKKENDDNWLSEFRSNDWIIKIIEGLTPPVYIQAPISTEGIENAPEISKGNVESTLNNLFKELGHLSSQLTNTPKFEIADFEKDDDLNFHILFTTATANLRCDNYIIKRTDFHSCKVIAGRIIAALATTTAAVCGLVILELFKVLLDKPTDALMNRQIGLASNTYTSFTQEPPKKFNTHVELTYPDPQEPLPSDAFDSLGRLKDEYIIKTTKRAYPESHSIWDKISCNSSLTLKQFAEWLRDDHKLKLNKWDFVVGYKNEVDSETKNKITKPFSTPVYPPKVVLDYSLLPSIDLTLPQATTAIMRNQKCKPTQQYLALWKECKQLGLIPDAATITIPKITENTTLKEILQHMCELADSALAEGQIETKVISDINSRKIWVIPGNEAPVCSDYETGEDIESICSIKIII
eukprot:CAMPEP_0196764110 /NCGR_PEP_ID=MMETSP1095-20130614/5364_1 /TAXON_ID=96789 ORGANISM="Chromulina nebulosa, Strain UTEXLB2642" /NCGR_SAMPLE_ID=MMETSP1095 /ASSEMBLY_ACC=CAM_ASM_000446 /LENGTH=1138 /DNA_ID=CAMNT_0042118757 /DNA_START=162 /DNA_END=3578 /DNA_ORIENTATION=-